MMLVVLYLGIENTSLTILTLTARLKVLDQMLAMRQEIAEFLNFPSYSHMNAVHRILKTPQHVMDFLQVSLRSLKYPPRNILILPTVDCAREIITDDERRIGFYALIEGPIQLSGTRQSRPFGRDI
jgi:hypothetical protein